jgi:hypothetical protein
LKALHKIQGDPQQHGAVAAPAQVRGDSAEFRLACLCCKACLLEADLAEIRRLLALVQVLRLQRALVTRALVRRERPFARRFAGRIGRVSAGGHCAEGYEHRGFVATSATTARATAAAG